MGNFTLKGAESLSRALEDIRLSLRTKLDAAVGEEADAILDDAKANYVPVDKGDLRDSGTVTENKIVTLSGPIEYTISFGSGESAAYAVTVHEHPSEHDPASWKKAGAVNFHKGGPKFLEIPFRKAATGMAERIAAKVKL